MQSGCVPSMFIDPHIRVGLNSPTLTLNQLSFMFSIDRKRNPEPWETVDPSVPGKVLLN